MKRFLAAEIDKDRIEFSELDNRPFLYHVVKLCQFSERVRDKTPGNVYVDLYAMRDFIHRNGIKYQIIGFSNLGDNQDRYPATVFYKNVGGERIKRWSRPLSDWSRSFVELSAKHDSFNLKEV